MLPIFVRSFPRGIVRRCDKPVLSPDTEVSLFVFVVRLTEESSVDDGAEFLTDGKQDARLPCVVFVIPITRKALRIPIFPLPRALSEILDHREESVFDDARDACGNDILIIFAIARNELLLLFLRTKRVAGTTGPNRAGPVFSLT